MESLKPNENESFKKENTPPNSEALPVRAPPTDPLHNSNACKASRQSSPSYACVSASAHAKRSTKPENPNERVIGR